MANMRRRSLILFVACTVSSVAGGQVTSIGDIEALPKPHARQANESNCANEGKGNKQGERIDTLTDLLKNRVDGSGQYSDVPFSVFLKLPWKGMKTRRYAWTPTQVARTAKYEGAAVAITGFIIEAQKKSKETSNCEIVADRWYDWHIWLVRTEAEAHARNKKKAIVVEVTPRLRHANPNAFDLVQLRQWAHDGQPVTVSGWLLLDPDHPTDASGTTRKKPSRGTIWEVHPVMRIEQAQ
jgi:hypothetical protein